MNEERLNRIVELRERACNLRILRAKVSGHVDHFAASSFSRSPYGGAQQTVLTPETVKQIKALITKDIDAALVPAQQEFDAA